MSMITMTIFYFIICFYLCTKEAQCSMPTILDKTEVFEGESVTVNCSASRIQGISNNSFCIKAIYLSSFNKREQRNEKLADYLVMPDTMKIFRNKSSWHFETYDRSNSFNQGKCVNAEDVGLILRIGSAQIEDGTLYKCMKEYDFDEVEKFTSVTLTVLAASGRRPTTSKVITKVPHSGNAGPQRTASAKDNHRATAGPVEHHTTSPVEHHTAGPVEHHTAGPVEHHTAGPVEHHTAGPVERHTAGPVENQTDRSVEDPTAGPVEDPTTGPVDNSTAGPGNETTTAGTGYPRCNQGLAIELFLVIWNFS